MKLALFVVGTRQKLLIGVGFAAILAVSAGAYALGDEASAGDAEETPEAIKADVLINIARYVEWPEGVFFRTNAPVLLGVYGKSPLLAELKKQARTKRVNGRAVVVRQFFWPLEPNCHVLYVSDTEKTRLANILAKVRYATVLTISETEQFTARGGMIRFALDEQKVQFTVNLAAATNANLKVSARLLNVAEDVQ